MKPPKILKKIAPENAILFLESDVNYTKIFLDNGSNLMSGYTLKHYQELESFKTFIRVNKHFLINSNYIKNLLVEKNKQAFEMFDGKIFQISRRRVKHFVEDFPLLKVQ